MVKKVLEKCKLCGRESDNLEGILTAKDGMMRVCKEREGCRSRNHIHPIRKEKTLEPKGNDDTSRLMKEG